MNSIEDMEKAFERGLKAWENTIALKHAKKMGQKIVREVKSLTPVDTGNLRRRWDSKAEVSRDDILIHVQNDAEYAAWVNNGHRIVRNGKTIGKAPAVHMLEKGISNYEKTYMQDDMEAMFEALKGAMR